MQIVVQALIRRVFAHKPRPLGRGGGQTELDLLLYLV